jgi:hypothetical protein
MYIPRNWEFGSALSRLINFGGGGGMVEHPHPRYATDLKNPPPPPVSHTVPILSQTSQTLFQFLATVRSVCVWKSPRPPVQQLQTKPADSEGGYVQRARNLPQDIPALLPNSIKTGYGSFGTSAPFVTALS